MKATIEAGLPGAGPLPIHLHTGKPTPWSEGFVIRFTTTSGSHWIGNLQTGFGYSTKIVEWPEATAFVVIANGAVYFVRPDQPNEWAFVDLLGIDCVVAPERNVAVISTYTDVVAITANGNELWRRTVAVDGMVINGIESGLIHGDACIEPPDEWHSFALQLMTGTDAG